MISTLSSFLLPTCVIAGLLAALVALLRAGKGLYPEPALPLQGRRILTGNEAEFFGRLKRALPGLEVLSQVSMGALLEVGLPSSHPDYWHIKRRFGLKVVDYVICRKGSMDIVSVVELDDRTHDSKQTQDDKRDQLLLAAGIPTIRWDSRHKPSQAEIARRVGELIAADKPKTV